MCICHSLPGYRHVQVVKRYNKYEKERQELIRGVCRDAVYCMLCVNVWLCVCVVRVRNTHVRMYYVCMYIRTYVTGTGTFILHMYVCSYTVIYVCQCTYMCTWWAASHAIPPLFAVTSSRVCPHGEDPPEEAQSHALCELKHCCACDYCIEHSWCTCTYTHIANVSYTYTDVCTSTN